jgi:hypothetical protein
MIWIELGLGGTNLRFDVNADGRVDIWDLFVALFAMGRTC